jgi:hypothetical protein
MQIKKELSFVANNMKKITIVLLLILFWCPLLRAKAMPYTFNFQNLKAPYRAALLDSSNYKIKVVDSDLTYSQVRFTIVDNHNDPLAAIVWLVDKYNKALSNVVSNKDGKVFIMIYDEKIQNINIGIIGYGRVSIPVNRIKNKITEIRVQLYQYISED